MPNIFWSPIKLYFGPIPPTIQNFDVTSLQPFLRHVLVYSQMCYIIFVWELPQEWSNWASGSTPVLTNMVLNQFFDHKVKMNVPLSLCRFYCRNEIISKSDVHWHKFLYCVSNACGISLLGPKEQSQVNHAELFLGFNIFSPLFTNNQTLSAGRRSLSPHFPTEFKQCRKFDQRSDICFLEVDYLTYY